MRIWHEQPDFISYHCARCGVDGYCHDRNSSVRIDPTRLRRLMLQANERQVVHVRRRRNLASWLWDGARLTEGTLAERYQRSRGITCPLPTTLRFRPAFEQYPPAMLAVFGIPTERTPGILDVADMMVHGVHITYLKPDGSGKAVDSESRDKRMIGPSAGWPIVLAPVNNLGELVIAEGIEDALSMHQAGIGLGDGLGAWAAGCASRLPMLAHKVPAYVECVTIAVDGDADGQRYAYELGRRLKNRGFETIMFECAGHE